MTDETKKSIDKLKALGTKQISIDTAISKVTVEKILNNEIEAIHDVKYNGFLSILEKHYDIDLSELRKVKTEEGEQDVIHNEIESSAASTKIKVLTVLTVLIVVIIVLNFFGTDESDQPSTIEPTPIVEQSLPAQPVATLNQSQVSSNATVVEPILSPNAVHVSTSKRTWFLVVSVNTDKKEEGVLTSNKTFELTNGTYLNIVNNYDELSYGNTTIKPSSTEEKTFLSYIDNAIKTISREEYIEQTRGHR